MGSIRKLRKEQWRIYDKLHEMDPTSAEYKTLYDYYTGLFQKETEMKKTGSGFKEKIAAGVLALGGIFAYRVALDKSADPFFKNIGSDITKLRNI